jgi:zinc protease
MTEPSSLMLEAIPGPDDILRVELENGITVLARESYTSPAVVVDGILPGGAIWDPAGKEGLGNFATRLRTRGTRDYTFNELFEVIEGNGANLELNSAYHTLSFGTKSLAEDLPTMLGLLSQVLRYPTFPEDYVEKVRGQLITQLQLRQQNTRAMASRRFRELVYPDEHPYGQSTKGTPESMEAITREDVLAFHEQTGPEGMVIVVVGGIDAQAAVRAVEETFGDWHNPDQRLIPTVGDAPRLTEVNQDTVIIPGKSQSDIVLGFPGPRRNAPDYQGARLANSILGVFGMYGRLGDSVREEQGLAYYSFSRMRGGWGPNPWQVIAGVAPENVDRAVESIRAEIRRIVEEPVSPDELADNQSFITGSLVLSLETNDGVANSIRSMEVYDLGLDYLHNFNDAINNVTIEDVQQAAQTYLDPDAYALAVAGPPQS